MQRKPKQRCNFISYVSEREANTQFHQRTGAFFTDVFAPGRACPALGRAQSACIDFSRSWVAILTIAAGWQHSAAKNTSLHAMVSQGHGAKLETGFVLKLSCCSQQARRPLPALCHHIPIAFSPKEDAQAIRNELQVRVKRKCFLLTCNEAHADVELHDAGAESSWDHPNATQQASEDNHGSAAIAVH